MRRGSERLRVGPWRGDARVAFVSPLADGLPPTTAMVQHACAILHERGYALAAFIGRHHDPLVPRTAGSKFASWLGWITCVAALAILGLSMIPFADSQQIAYGLPPLLSALLMSTPVLAVLVAGVLVCTIIAWSRGYWRASARWHYTTVLVAGLAFVWFLREWNLLGVYT